MTDHPLKYAQHIIPDASGDAMSGFNCRIMGYSERQTLEGRTWGIGAVGSGWRLADGMARKGKIYATHNFHHSHECRGHAFPYGGKFVCETCTWPGYPDLRKDWWKIKCYPDGSAWCCVGPDFINLQASDCFAFGDTYDEAIRLYGGLMIAQRDATGPARPGTGSGRR